MLNITLHFSKTVEKIPSSEQNVHLKVNLPEKVACESSLSRVNYFNMVLLHFNSFVRNLDENAENE